MAEPKRYKFKIGWLNRQEVEWTHHEFLEFRRSKVRMWTTYLAMLFLFGVGGFFVASLAFLESVWHLENTTTTGNTTVVKYLFDKETFDAAKDIFTLILPVATGIVGFWFAGRGGKKPPDGETG